MLIVVVPERMIRHAEVWASMLRERKIMKQNSFLYGDESGKGKKHKKESELEEDSDYIDEDEDEDEDEENDYFNDRFEDDDDF